jgi:hypothetical protein
MLHRFDGDASEDENFAGGKNQQHNHRNLHVKVSAKILLYF